MTHSVVVPSLYTNSLQLRSLRIVVRFVLTHFTITNLTVNASHIVLRFSCIIGVGNLLFDSLSYNLLYFSKLRNPKEIWRKFVENLKKYERTNFRRKFSQKIGKNWNEFWRKIEKKILFSLFSDAVPLENAELSGIIPFFPTLSSGLIGSPWGPHFKAR